MNELDAYLSDLDNQDRYVDPEDWAHMSTLDDDFAAHGEYAPE